MSKSPIVHPDKPVLVLRTCSADMTSYNGFVWPREGEVSCPGWKPTKACGHGLHGLLWGAGDGSLLDWSENAVWMVVEIDHYIDIDGGKVKFEYGIVRYAGGRAEAISLITLSAPPGTNVVGGTASAGDRGTASAGYRGTASAGHEGTASAGYRGTASAGDTGIITIRYRDDSANRCRIFVGYVGEDGIEPNTKYRYSPETGLVKAD